MRASGARADPDRGSECAAAKLRAGKSGGLEVATRRLDAFECDAGEVGADQHEITGRECGQSRTGKLAAAQIDAVEAGVADDRALQIRADKVTIDQIGFADFLAGQVRACEIAALEYRPVEIGGAQIGCRPEVGAHR